MIHIILGHRGTGKSKWLQVISEIHKEAKEDILCFDLDQEVEFHSKKSIHDLFQIDSTLFREWEQKIFLKIIKSVPKNKKVFIAVGAGFQLKKVDDIKIIHLCRETDRTERIFFDRPSLDPKKNPREEYLYFYKKRNSIYLKNKDEIFYRMEHFKNPQLSDYLFFGIKKLKESYFSIRIRSDDVLKNHSESFLKKRLNWGIRFFEIHDSDANEKFIKEVLKFIPMDKILFSSQCNDKFKKIKNKIHWSWDLSLGEPPEGVTILALHERKKSIKETLKYFSSYKNYHLKLSVEIFNFKELWEAYSWYREDSKNRSFLPRSSSGMWKWFRNAFGSEMFLHFIHEGESEIKDQPLFSEAIHYKNKSDKKAGLLGFPIFFSQTPKEHHSFFYKERFIPIFSIPMKADQMNQENLDILKNLGFVFFAITSPLKQQAFHLADYVDEESKKFKSVNTFILHCNRWHAYNTDVKGLEELKIYKNKKVAVWGGGGVLSVLKNYLPEAILYSARTGEPRDSKSNNKSFSPDIVIWSIGNSHINKGCQFPADQWNPSKIIDLNYVENSPGREYAKKVKSHYTNGDFLFKKQAQAQRELYLKLEKK